MGISIFAGGVFAIGAIIYLVIHHLKIDGLEHSLRRIRAEHNDLKKQVADLQAQKSILANTSDQTEEAQAPAPKPQKIISLPSDTITAPALNPGAQPAPKPNPAPYLPPKSAPPTNRGFEDLLGSTWSVWVGAVALAIGGIFLVRFSIEQGFFGPLARIAMGCVFGCALVAAGEWWRRRDLTAGHAPAAQTGLFESPRPAAALTAAGATCLFAAVYAAYAIYGFIGPAAAFIALGLVAGLTMISAAVQGPALAALGLPAALVAPHLISSAQPSLWPLVPYTAAIVTVAYVLARMRYWPWLKYSAAGGAFVWGAMMTFSTSGEPIAAITFVLVQLSLFAAFFAALPPLNAKMRPYQTDWPAILILSGFAILSMLALALPINPTARALNSGSLIAIFLVIGKLRIPLAASSLIAAVVTFAAVCIWPVTALTPEPSWLNIAFAAVATAAVSGLSLRRVLQRKGLSFDAMVFFTISTAVTPPAVLTAFWAKTAHFATSIPFAIIAVLIALTGAAIVSVLQRAPKSTSINHRMITGAIASASIASLTLGLIFALDKGVLTVAIAITIPTVAWIAVRLGLPTLPYAVAGLATLVLGRIITNPMIVAPNEIGPNLVFNWLLWGYGIPALSFGATAWQLERQRWHAVSALCKSIALILTTMLAAFQIRHAFTNGNLFSTDFSHAEVGVFVIVGLFLSMIVSSLNQRHPEPVYRIGDMLLWFASMIIIVLPVLIINNPLRGFENVHGGLLLNSLIPGYLLPGLFLGALVVYGSTQWPTERKQVTVALSLSLIVAYAALEIRRYFHGENIAFRLGSDNAEWLTYTVVLLLIGVGLLIWGVLTQKLLPRQASAICIVAAVIKAFLSDMANLDGIWRALSFIALGLVLIGIARAYQRLLKPAKAAG